MKSEKMKKVVCLGLTGALACGMLTGCGSVSDILQAAMGKEEKPPIEDIKPTEPVVQPEVEQEEIPEVEKPIEETENTQDGEFKVVDKLNEMDRKSYKFLSEFLTSGKKGFTDEEIYKYFNIPEDSLVSVADINYILAKTGADQLFTYNSGELHIADYRFENSAYTVKVEDEFNTDFTLKYDVVDDGSLKFNIKSYLVENISFKIPTTGEIKIDGQVVNLKNMKKLEEHTLIQVPAMVMKEHTIQYNTAFKDNIESQVILTEKDSETLKEIVYELTSLEATDYLEITKNNINKIYEITWVDSPNAAELDKLVVDDFEVSKKQNILKARKNSEIFATNRDAVQKPTVNRIDVPTKLNSTIIGEKTLKFVFKYELNVETWYNGIGRTSNVTTFIYEKVGNELKLKDTGEKLFVGKINPAVDDWDKG